MAGAEAPTTSGSAPAVAAAPESKPKMTFKGAARLVVAAKRFQAALNPTYTYGKRADSGGNANAAASGWTKTGGDAGATSSSPVEIASAKAAAATAAGTGTPPVGTPPLGSTPPKKVFDHHGHKGDLLFAPLPDVLPAEKA